MHFIPTKFWLLLNMYVLIHTIRPKLTDMYEVSILIIATCSIEWPNNPMIVRLHAPLSKLSY